MNLDVVVFASIEATIESSDLDTVVASGAIDSSLVLLIEADLAPDLIRSSNNLRAWINSKVTAKQSAKGTIKVLRTDNVSVIRVGDVTIGVVGRVSSVVIGRSGVGGV